MTSRFAALALVAVILAGGAASAGEDGPSPAPAVPPAPPAPPAPPVGPSSGPESPTSPPATAGQVKATRRDLALRLVALDETIRARPEAFTARRRATAEAVSRATLAFFTGTFVPAMDSLGQATAALRGAPWDVPIAALSRMRVEAQTVVATDAVGGLEVRLVPLGPPPEDDLSVAVLATWAGDDAATRRARVALAALPIEALRAGTRPALRVEPPQGGEIRPGRHRIELRLRVARASAPKPVDPTAPPPAEEVLLATEIAVVTADTPARLAAAKASLASIPKVPQGTPGGVRPTLERLVRRIEAALSGQVRDVVPDVADELRRVEEGVAGLRNAAEAGHGYVPSRASLAGDSHRHSAEGKAYRLYVPPPKEGPAAPLPLLVALHGAGGNEDMYFEAYGAGEALRLCAERGWILAAPDAPHDAVAVAEDVCALLDVDPRRIHLTGHSMGAGAAWAAVGARPTLWASFATVGGGGIVPTVKNEGNRGRMPPVLAVTGEIDFGRSGTEGTAKRAKAAGFDVEVRVLPELDHLLVVGASLPEILFWFAAHPRD